MTTTARLADPAMGRNRQIMVLLAALAVEDIEISDGDYIETKPYGNCREQGFVIVVHANSKVHNLAFFEHRNSDEICALRWEGYGHITGVVRVDDIPKEAFPDKWTHYATLKWMDIAGGIDLAREFVEDAVQPIADDVDEAAKVCPVFRTIVNGGN